LKNNIKGKKRVEMKRKQLDEEKLGVLVEKIHVRRRESHELNRRATG
jgi:hypothetical protein